MDKTRELQIRALGTLSDCESSNARSGKPVTIGIEKEEQEPPTRCMYGPSVSLAEEHRQTYPVPSGVPPPIPTHSKPPMRSTETRTSHQRRFAGAHKIPHTAPWVAQQLHESKTDTAIGILASWTHPKRRLEVTEATIAELNQLPDDLAVDALKELKGAKKYIQGIGGTKLEMRVILEPTRTTLACLKPKPSSTLDVLAHASIDPSSKKITSPLSNSHAPSPSIMLMVLSTRMVQSRTS